MHRRRPRPGLALLALVGRRSRIDAAAIESPGAAPASASAEPSARVRMIAEIRAINRSASPEWLDRFSDRALSRYRDHLRLSQLPRDARSTWVRDGAVPALLAFCPEE